MNTRQGMSAELSALEPEQQSAAVRQPLPRAHLGPYAVLSLWILRVYSIIAVGLVAYVFVRTLWG
jgi:hypothetical protein